MAINFINDGDGIKLLHKIVGFSASGFVLLRVIYGFSAKLSPGVHHLFRYWPLDLKSLHRFLKSEASGSPLQYEGHNPAASWDYIGIWAAVICLGVTGFMMGLDAYWGEEWLEDLHAVIANLLLVLIVIHFLGIIKDAIRLRRKSWMRMISGR